MRSARSRVWFCRARPQSTWRGVSLDSTNQWVLITGSGVTLNGYDFTQGGGWTIVIEAPNVTISNFIVGVVAGKKNRIQSKSFRPETTSHWSTAFVNGGGAAGANTFGALISDEQRSRIGHYPVPITGKCGSAFDRDRWPKHVLSNTIQRFRWRHVRFRDAWRFCSSVFFEYRCPI